MLEIACLVQISMNEYQVIKKSPYVYLIGLAVFAVVAIWMKSITYVLGFTLGYGMSLLVFLVIIKMSDLILSTQQSTAIVVVMFFVKLLLYSIGLLAGIFLKEYFNLFAVFIGYLVTKITIYIGTYLERRGCKK